MKRLAALILGAGLVAATLSPSTAAPGDLDTGYGTGGAGEFLAPNAQQTAGVAIDDAQRAVVVGLSNNVATIWRVTRAGTLDATFDGDGQATIAGFHRFFGVVIQPNGKIVAVGQDVIGAGADFAIVRLLPSGAPDTAFSGDGKQTVSIGSYDQAVDVALAPDGKIVVAGQSYVDGLARFSAVRLRPNGSLDTSFSGDGKRTTAFDPADESQAYAVEVFPDGRILLAGQAWEGLIDDFPPYNIGLVRLKSGGALDPTFGTGGKVVTDLGANASVTDSALQTNGRIVVVGTIGSDMIVARYRPGGVLDTTFSSNGYTPIPFGEGSRGNAVAIQGNGRIIVGGEVGGADRDFAVAALKAKTGLLDTAFSGDGRLRQDLGSNTDVISIHGLAIQRDEKIVAAGSTQNVGTASDVITMRVVNRDPSKTTLKIRKRARRTIARGKVSPNHSGKRVVVTMFKRKNGAFRKVATKRPNLRATSSYRAAFNRPQGGRCRVVTRFLGDPHHRPSKARKTFRC